MKPIALCALFVVGLCGIAYAADGGEHHYDWKNFAFRIVNFVIFVAILYKAFGKKATDFFRTRRYTIENELEDLNKRKADAETRLAEVGKSIADLESERKRILVEYQAQGEALKASIIEKAKKSAEQIKAQAELTGVNEAKAAVEAMRAEMADLVVAAAEKVIAEKLTKAEHEKLIEKYLAKVVLQ